MLQLGLSSQGLLEMYAKKLLLIRIRCLLVMNSCDMGCLMHRQSWTHPIHALFGNVPGLQMPTC